MAPALTASDSQMCWTWTFCRRGAIAPARPTWMKMSQFQKRRPDSGVRLALGASWNSVRWLGSIMESACGLTGRLPEAAEAASARNFGA